MTKNENSKRSKVGRNVFKIKSICSFVQLSLDIETGAAGQCVAWLAVVTGGWSSANCLQNCPPWVQLTLDSFGFAWAMEPKAGMREWKGKRIWSKSWSSQDWIESVRFWRSAGHQKSKVFLSTKSPNNGFLFGCDFIPKIGGQHKKATLRFPNFCPTPWISLQPQLCVLSNPTDFCDQNGKRQTTKEITVDFDYSAMIRFADFDWVNSRSCACNTARLSLKSRLNDRPKNGNASVMTNSFQGHLVRILWNGWKSDHFRRQKVTKSRCLALKIQWWLFLQFLKISKVQMLTNQTMRFWNKWMEQMTSFGLSFVYTWLWLTFLIFKILTSHFPEWP